jgi:adenine deaminase
VALQMATLNTAEHFGLAREVGQIAPGRYADVLLVGALDTMEVEAVYARGECIAREGRWVVDLPRYAYPDEVKSSVHLPRPLRAEDFRLPVSSDGPLTVHVIGVIENQAPTRHLVERLQPTDGHLSADVAHDLAKVALVERHRGSGAIQVGLVRGFGFSVGCAVGSTVAHDSHQMILVGTDDADMALAGNELARTGGGQVVVRGGKVAARVELPIAGLITDERADVVADKAESVLAAIRDCGCRLNNANMQLSLLGLVVIPQLRISDKGLVDVDRYEVIPLVDSTAREAR